MSPIRIVQITDTHLRTPPGPLRGMEKTTDESLIQVLKHVKSAEKDFLLCTGDLSDTPDARTYQRLIELLTPLSVPVYCLPGNHDDPEIAADTCARSNLLWQKIIDLDQWVIIMLDSFLRDETHGQLGDKELNFLNDQLKIFHNRHILICLHHHPIHTGSMWMDEIMLKDGDQFFDVVDQFTHIRGILWGHIHQEFDKMRRGIRLLGSPSTCRQFKPDEDDFIIDDNHPGFRELILHGDGSIDTRVYRCP